MKICVQGLWHLGSVTAACLAEAGFDTVGLAEDDNEAMSLGSGEPPLYEPGLSELFGRGLESGKLRFTSDTADALKGADVVWISYDTPVNDDDTADVGYVENRIVSLFDHLEDQTVVLISSQLPAGTTQSLSRKFQELNSEKQIHFCYSPENLRLGQAIEAFTQAERIIVGTQNNFSRSVLEPIIGCFTSNILWVKVESAEMIKHALNAYLATAISFTNEVANICELVGGDAREVESALRLDPRIGTKAYVRAGAAFGGGTLARDIQFLRSLATERNLDVPIVSHVLDSNAYHQQWVVRRLKDRLGDLGQKRIGILGLAYKPGTGAIRRSVAIDLGKALSSCGASVFGYDPVVSELPEELQHDICATQRPDEVFQNSDAVILATEWPEFGNLDYASMQKLMNTTLLIDPNRFLEDKIGEGWAYLAVGRSE